MYSTPASLAMDPGTKQLFAPWLSLNEGFLGIDGLFWPPPFLGATKKLFTGERGTKGINEILLNFFGDG